VTEDDHPKLEAVALRRVSGTDHPAALHEQLTVEAARRYAHHHPDWAAAVDHAVDQVLESVALVAVGPPVPGFVDQLRRNAAERQRFLDCHGALSAEEVADFEDRSIFAVEHQGRTLYPGFQFDPGTRKPLPAVGEALSRLPSGLTGWELALWWDTPLVLDGEWVTPLEAIGDPARVSHLAQAEADRWRNDGAVSREDDDA
jgi:hypothetical protein